MDSGTGLSKQSPPLVATLALDPAAQEYFNTLRSLHFPAARNYLKAHLTLFHALPHEPGIIADLQNLAQEHRKMEVEASNIVSLGHGTAIKVTSPALHTLHQTLQKRLFGSLTTQDRQKRNFHITIQNKVELWAAKELQADLSQTFKPFSFFVTGIQLWRYLGGPWEYLQTIDFPAEPTA